MAEWSLPHRTEHWPWYEPTLVALNQTADVRPGTACIFTPKDGIVQEWMTSFDVTSTCNDLVDRHGDLLIDRQTPQLLVLHPIPEAES